MSSFVLIKRDCRSNITIAKNKVLYLIANEPESPGQVKVYFMTDHVITLERCNTKDKANEALLKWTREFM